jgi:hypothetical protein
MALRKTFGELAVRFNELCGAVDALQRAASDHPTEPAVTLARIFGDGADDVDGFLVEARAAAAAADAAIGPPVDLDRMRIALVEAEVQYLHAAERLERLTGCEQVMELDNAVRELGREGRDWALGVRDAVEQCREQSHDIVPALFACFEELTERATASAVSVQTTNIGQQVSAPQ